MEPAEIVRRCLGHGLLVSQEDIKRIGDETDLDEFISSRKQTSEQPEDTEGRITVRQRKREQKNIVLPCDCVGFYKSKYDALKSILLMKTSAVSIGNAHESAFPVSLIGMVKQSGEKSFTLEDITGEIEVEHDGKAAPENDDVICARGPIRGGRMLCRDIIFPDIPLLRPIGKIKASLLLLPKSAEIAGTSAHIIVSTEPVNSNARNVVIGSSPAHISMHNDGKVQLLFYKPGNAVSQQDAINMLRRRCLKPPAGMANAVPRSDDYIIEPVPDILWLLAEGDEWIGTYKGVTMVHSHEKPVLINLETREAKFV